MSRSAVGHVVRVNPDARDAAARLLAAKRAEVEAQLAAVRAESDRSTASASGLGFGKRVGDTTSVAVERMTEVAAHGGLLTTLRQLERAEQRLDEGSYGRCEWCGEQIPDERLEARPFATTCVRCA